MKFFRLPKLSKKIKFIVFYAIIFLLVCAIVGAYYFKGYLIEGATFNEDVAIAKTAYLDASNNKVELIDMVNKTKGNVQLGNTYLLPALKNLIQMGNDKTIATNAYKDATKTSEKSRALPEISGKYVTPIGGDMESKSRCALQSVGWYEQTGPAPLASSVAKAAGVAPPTFEGKATCP